uniref:Uncharacterized protein n=1 Tax=viral metagenome TaxID=1070528 RepID=A0A6C0CBZ5_9ZZZZ
MAGQYTRLMYDQDAYVEELERSTEPLTYMLDPNFANNCNECFAPYGMLGGQTSIQTTGLQVDVDSLLRGVNKINSKSNKQSMPEPMSEYSVRMRRDCSPALESENTRYTYPAYDIRGLTVRDLRFDYPLFDPQCQIFENFAVDTRLQAKDNHRATWQVPYDQRDLLPTERLGKPEACRAQINCNLASFTS